MSFVVVPTVILPAMMKIMHAVASRFSSEPDRTRVIVTPAKTPTNNHRPLTLGKLDTRQLAQSRIFQQQSLCNGWRIVSEEVLFVWPTTSWHRLRVMYSLS